jgi:uncharacterized protein YceH (UPF0502 family)
MVELNAVEARVLGALMEKEMTTPEYYPLSLNALVNACNQKSSRDPVMELAEADVRGALFALEELALVRTLADRRVSKFEHRTRDGLNLRRDEFAVVCLLLLRGPQTPAELRARAERLYSFDDVAAVLATLERLAAREEPLTRVMQRQPGAREVRWTQLLTGAVSEAVVTGAHLKGEGADVPRGKSSGANEELQQRVEALEEMVFSLEQRLFALEEAAAAKRPETD